MAIIIGRDVVSRLSFYSLGGSNEIVHMYKPLTLSPPEYCY